MHRLQNAFDHIAAACHASGIQEAVLCPGSRNAPLIVAFVRSGLFRCVSVADERSAGFIALGKALATGKSVALICTSGSAGANFYPAVLEAYYQKVPLVVLTADRPPERIDQWDGQTIRQKNLFGSHVKGFFETPDEYIEADEFAAISENAVQLSQSGLKGPVHMNVPIREPFYPSVQHQYNAHWELRIKKESIQAFQDDVPSLAGKKVMVIRGFASFPKYHPHKELALYEDIVSGGSSSSTLSELLFLNKDLEELKKFQPDVLLSDGTAILSKPFKQFLRKFGPAEHYHFSVAGEIADPFESKPQLVRSHLDVFLQNREPELVSEYSRYIISRSEIVREKHVNFLNTNAWNDFTAIRNSLNNIPRGSVLHAANSMAVRYLAYEEPGRKGYKVYGNRGTSGIDGCVSTALGFLSGSDKPNYLFVGDVAFFYDSNAFWNGLGTLPLKVILINNGGGGIFNLIDGPVDQPERLEYFETAHHRNAEKLCENLGVSYFRAENQDELLQSMAELNLSSGPAVLEVFTDRELNQQFFNQYKSIFHGI